MNETATKGRWRRIGLGVAAALVVAAALWALYRPRALLVELADVRTGRFEQAVEEDGQLRLRQRYVVHAPVPGQLQRPALRVGDTVRAGQPLVELTPVAPQMIDVRTREVLQQRLGSAEAARVAAATRVSRAEVALAQARQDADRARRLAEGGFTAAAAREQAERALASAEQALRGARAEQTVADFGLAEARAALTAASASSGGRVGAWSLRSPVDGRVLKIHEDSAGPVAAGQPLVEVGDTRALEAVIDVLSTEAPQVKVGAAVRLTVGTGVPALAGRVQRVEPVAFTKVSALGIEEQRVNVVVDLDAPPPAPLGDGFRVDARIVVAAHDDVVLVPTAALVRDGAGWRVFVAEGGRARARPVQVRARNASHAWIAEGLKAGEPVVLYPGALVGDGQRIRVQAAR